MKTKFTSALEIYRNRGLLGLLGEIRRYITENGVRQSLSAGVASVKYGVSRLPVIDGLCFLLSKRELERRKNQEESLSDVIATVGTSADQFTPPDQYRGYGVYRSLLTTHAKPTITQVVKEVEGFVPRTIVEIGTLRGGSLYIWSRSFASADRLVSIDIDPEIERRERLFETFAEDKRIDFVSGDSHSDETVEKVRQRLDGNEIDFLYIDGEHTYEAVREDFETYLPLMASDGIIGFDDISPAFPGVYEFWQEIEAEYETKEVGYIDDDLPPAVGENVSGLVYL